MEGEKAKSLLFTLLKGWFVVSLNFEGKLRGVVTTWNQSFALQNLKSLNLGIWTRGFLCMVISKKKITW
jgi:hypothetical protein